MFLMRTDNYTDPDGSNLFYKLCDGEDQNPDTCKADPSRYPCADAVRWLKYLLMVKSAGFQSLLGLQVSDGENRIITPYC